MLQNIEIQNFKQFAHLFVPRIAPITLLGGKNNAGKTSFLEAVYLCYAQPDDVFLKLNGIRRVSPLILSPKELWEPYFYQREVVKNPIKIQWLESAEEFLLEAGRQEESEGELTEEFSLRNPSPHGGQNAPGRVIARNYPLFLRVEKKGGENQGEHSVFRLLDNASATVQRKVSKSMQDRRERWNIKYLSAHFAYGTDEVIQAFGQLDLDNRKEEVIRAAQIIDPRIRDISTIVTDGQSGRLFATAQLEGGAVQKIPLQSMGDGVNRLLVMVISILATPGGIVLIDEMENGLHYSIQGRLWELLIRAAKSVKAQIIATTHSNACQMGASEALAKLRKEEGLIAEKDFLYLRMAKAENGTIHARPYDQETFLHALKNGIEVR